MFVEGILHARHRHTATLVMVVDQTGMVFFSRELMIIWGKRLATGEVRVLI